MSSPSDLSFLVEHGVFEDPLWLGPVGSVCPSAWVKTTKGLCCLDLRRIEKAKVLKDQKLIGLDGWTIFQ